MTVDWFEFIAVVGSLTLGEWHFHHFEDVSIFEPGDLHLALILVKDVIAVIIEENSLEILGDSPPKLCGWVLKKLY